MVDFYDHPGLDVGTAGLPMWFVRFFTRPEEWKDCPAFAGYALAVYFDSYNVRRFF